MVGSKQKGPSQRQLRVAEEIRHILAELLSQHRSGHELLDHSSITVTEVRVSPDLLNATVFVIPLGGIHLPEIIEALKEKAWFFRRQLAQQLTLRTTPRLVFQADLSFDAAQRIEAILNSAKVRQDTQKDDK